MQNVVDTGTTQARTDFTAVRAQGYGTAIVKMGGGNDGLYVAPWYAFQLANVRAAGMNAGHYWMNGSQPVQQQLSYFLRNVDYRRGDRIMLDIETIDGVPHMTPADALVWLRGVYAATGILPLVYMNEALENAVDWSPVAAEFPHLVIAMYVPGREPRLKRWHSWTGWQYTQDGALRGVLNASGQPASIDLNRFIPTYPLGGPMSALWPNGSTVQPRLSEGYGPRSGDLVAAGARPFHYGVDIPLPLGSKLYAARAGKVIFSGSNGTLGVQVVLQTDVGQFLYPHMEAGSQLALGSEVVQGQVVGRVGMTGLTTGPHTCFRTFAGSWQRDADARNPVDFMAELNAGVASTDVSEIIQSEEDEFMALNIPIYGPGGITDVQSWQPVAGVLAEVLFRLRHSGTDQALADLLKVVTREGTFGVTYRNTVTDEHVLVNIPEGVYLPLGTGAQGRGSHGLLVTARATQRDVLDREPNILEWYEMVAKTIRGEANREILDRLDAKSKELIASGALAELTEPSTVDPA